VATNGSFTTGYTYSFRTVGTDVIATFELLDNRTGIQGYAWTYNPNFAESIMTANGKIVTKIFSGQTLGATFKMACKFAYAGGMSVTKQFTYTVGKDCSTGTVPSQIPTIDFETVGKDWTWTMYENGDNAASLFTFINNPSTSGINPSATCAKFIVNANAANWAQVQTSGFSPITFTADNNKVKVMLYKSVISNFVITLQNADASVKVQKFAPNTKINEWELMTFDFSGLIGKTVTKMVVYPDYPSVRTAGSTNYIDNIFFNSLTNVVTEIVTRSINLYPNPVNDILHIQLPGNNSRITMYDIVGNKVYDQQIQTDYELDMSNYKTGIYIFRAENAKGTITGKVLKNK
jgi:hypothetical protein